MESCGRFTSLGDDFLMKERFRNSAERLSGHAQWRPVSALHHTEGLTAPLYLLQLG